MEADNLNPIPKWWYMWIALVSRVCCFVCKVIMKYVIIRRFSFHQLLSISSFRLLLSLPSFRQLPFLSSFSCPRSYFPLFCRHFCSIVAKGYLDLRGSCARDGQLFCIAFVTTCVFFFSSRLSGGVRMRFFGRTGRTG